MHSTKPGGTPPRWLDRLVERFCDPELLEQVLGDLHERYYLQLAKYGEPKTRWRYAIEVFSYLRQTMLTRRSTQKNRTMMTDMMLNYMKVARRSIYRNKTYSLINVLGLALGIGCAMLIFSVVKFHLSFDSFHPQRDRLYRIVTEFHQDGITLDANVPQPLGAAFRNDFALADQVARIYSRNEALISVHGENGDLKVEEDIAFVEPEFFEMFNFPIAVGSSPAVLKDPNTALITKSMATRLFGDQDPINRLVKVDNLLEFKVMGILADLPPNTDRHDEIYLSYSNLKDYNPWLAGESWPGISGGMNCFTLLKTGTTLAEVDTALSKISTRYYNQRDASIYRFRLQPIWDVHLNPQLGGAISRKSLWVMSLVAFILVVTACLNFISLATAMAMGRSSEVGVRKALGSQRGQLFWQFMTETAAITLIALVLAVVFAQLTLPFVNQLLNLRIDLGLATGEFFVFVLAIFLLVTFLAGSYPGVVVSRFKTALALKGKIAASRIGGFSLQRAMVVVQFAISMLLIISTLVIGDQMQYASKADMGFDKDAVVMLSIPNNSKSNVDAFGVELSRISGVEGVSFCSRPPASTNWATVGVRYDNRQENEPFDITVKAGDHQYLSTFGLQLVAGRNLEPSDTVREFLLNETAVARFGLTSADDVLGKKIRVGLNNSVGTVVGVVKDFHHASFHEQVAPVCITSANKWYGMCAVKVNSMTLTATLQAVETQWKKVFPDHIYTATFLDDQIARFYEADQMVLSLSRSFAAIAIVIGCLGLYGLVSFMVVQKTKEVGVRKVLGANVPSILWLFGKEFLQLILVAFAIAAPLGWWAMDHWLQNFSFRIELSPFIFLAAIGVTVIVAITSIGYLSLRSALANPVDSLRDE